MEARVKQDYFLPSLIAFSGVEFTRAEWRAVPEGFEEEAKKHPFLDVQPSLKEIRFNKLKEEDRERILQGEAERTGEADGPTKDTPPIVGKDEQTDAGKDGETSALEVDPTSEVAGTVEEAQTEEPFLPLDVVDVEDPEPIEVKKPTRRKSRKAAKGKEE